MINSEIPVDVITSVTLWGLRGIKNDCQFTEDNAPIFSDRWKKPLADAEQLGKACAVFLLDTERKTTAGENWLDTINKLGLRDRLSQAPDDLLISSYAERVMRLKGFDDPQMPKVIEERLLKENHADFSMNDLQNPRLMIFSPLATDYPLACLIHAFFEKFRPGHHFMLKPIIVSSRSTVRRLIAVPNFDDIAYAQTRSVRVFVDNSTSGEAMRVSKEAAAKFIFGKYDLL